MFEDPYCFPGTNVLRNLLGIRDPKQLEQYESEIAGFAGDALYKNPAKVTNLDTLRAIHKRLFGKVYPWAGETRCNLGRMTKTRHNGTTVLYGDSAFVETELAKTFDLLKAENYLRGLDINAFAMRAAWFYGELDAIHAFREGNSRTLRAFFASVAYNAGYKFAWDAFGAVPENRERLYAARDMAVMRGDSTALAEIFASILRPL